MNNYIKTLININKDAVENINTLEEAIKNYIVVNDKTKANFGNLCVMLKGYRDIANSSECLLINEDVLKDDDGNYYQKINQEPDVVVPPTQGPVNGSDFDKDKTRVDKGQ